jgi:hypothetical protein
MREYNNNNILIFLGGSCDVNLDALDMDFILHSYVFCKPTAAFSGTPV